MKTSNGLLFFGACLGLAAAAGALTPTAARAQAAAFPDAPADHWAYAAVRELADKGFVRGYPDGKFLGDRALSRYEFATVIDRMVQELDELRAKQAAGDSGAGAALRTPTGHAVTPDDLNQIEVLVDNFRVQLTAIQSDIGGLDAKIAVLQNDALAERSATAKAQSTADASYGSSASRKFSITGYLQLRAVTAQSGDRARFPQGTNATSGAYNGNYAQAGVQDSLEVRRARFRFSGAPTSNTGYAIQIDAAGAVSSGTTANQQVTVREAWGSYTPGNGGKNYPTATAGLFSNPFGYALPTSPSSQLTPERPLAFNEANNVGLWDSDDYVKGVKAQYAVAGFGFAYAALNSAGRQAEGIDDHFDSVYRVSYAAPGSILNVGASYYDGFVYRTRPGGLPVDQFTYPAPRKELFGLDGQLSYQGFFADAEYVRGKYEKRAYFNENAATAANPTGADTLVVDSYVSNNQVQGYYLWSGYTFGARTDHPLTLGLDYDVFQRSIDAHANAANALGANTIGGTFFPSGSSFDDVNIGYGALYNLDKSTRLRLWYDAPQEVAHAPGTPPPPHIGLGTAEVQVRF